MLNVEDPDASSAVKAYLKGLYNGAKVEASVADESELASRVEKKYVAAQIVEGGIQNIAVPLGDGSAAVKRYVAQLLSLGQQAGFEDPAVEVEKRIAEQSQTAETVKELLTKIKPFMSSDMHSALSEAVQQVESETNGAVLLDGSSAGYKLFAEKVKSIATASNIPWKTLVDYKKGSADEDVQDKLNKDYAAWLQSARVADAAAELNALRAEATTLLDKHLGKTAEQVRKEQAASVQQLIRRAEAAKGAQWAQQYLEDVKRVQWFDACVAENPAVGPKVSA